MPWITNHKHKIEEKSTKSSRSSSKVVGLGPADLWEFPTLLTRVVFNLLWNINPYLQFPYKSKPPHEPPSILSSTPELGWTPLSCGMADCWQINSILALAFFMSSKSALFVHCRTAVLKISTICHARNLAGSCKQLHLLCLPDPWNLSGTALLGRFQSSK